MQKQPLMQMNYESLMVRLASLTEKADIVQKYIQKNVERIKQIAEEQQRLADAETDIDAECASAEAAANGIDLGSSANGQDIKNTQLELANLRSALQAANDEISALRIRHTAANRERISAENELKRLNAELADAETGAMPKQLRLKQRSAIADSSTTSSVR